MDTPWGMIVYWVATILAALIVLVVVIGYFSNAGEGDPVVPIIAPLLAGAIWLLGWASRRVHIGR